MGRSKGVERLPCGQTYEKGRTKLYDSGHRNQTQQQAQRHYT